MKHTKESGNLPFGSVKGLKGLTDEFCGFKKLRKRSIFVMLTHMVVCVYLANSEGGEESASVAVLSSLTPKL